MASNEHLRLIKSHILRESDKLCLIKTLVEDKNSQTCIAAVWHRIERGKMWASAAAEQQQ